jgi:hypothetical protein
VRDKLDAEEVAAFWMAVGKGDPCWTWNGMRRGGKNGPSYGLLRLKGRGLMRAHRASWLIHFGPIADGLGVCHRCDNPQCTNPDHLFLGTQADNMRDAVSKERCVRGEAVNSAVLTALTVRMIRIIRSETGIGAKALSKELGLPLAAVTGVMYRGTWRHVR